MAQRGQTTALCIPLPCAAGTQTLPVPPVAWGFFCKWDLITVESAMWQDTDSDLLAMQVADPSRQRTSGCLLPCVYRQQILLLLCSHGVSGFRSTASARPEGDLAGATPWTGRAR